MTATVTFRDFRPDDRDPLIQLMGEGRHAGYRDSKRALFNWQFFDAPGARQRSPFIVGIAEDRIVAANGFMPVRLKVGADRVDGAWSCDTFVSPTMRGVGLGKQLVSRVSASHPIVLGYGISDMSDPIFEKFGWWLDATLLTYFLPVDERGMRGLAKQVRSKMQRALRGRTTDSSLEITTEQSPRWDDYGALWSRHSGDYACAVERSGEYLRWKYGEHPRHRYIVQQASQRGEARGVLISRHDPKVSVIVDYVGPGTQIEVMVELLAATVEDLSRRGTTRIKFESNHQPLKQAMEAVGFLASRYSSRFRVCNTAAIPAAADGWLITSGDSDGDVLIPD